MRGKTLLSALVLVGTFGIVQDDQKPYGYSDKTGYPTSALSFLGTGGGTSSIYADATACWSFNDNTDLGNDDCTDTYDLTLVNTPTATGGALGYSADMERDTSQYATGGDILDLGSGVSWGFAFWYVPESLTGNTYILSKMINTVTAGDYWGAHHGADSATLNCGMYDGAGAKSDLKAAVFTAGTRVFIACRYNATTNTIEAGSDGGWTGSATSTVGDGSGGAAPFNINSYNNGTAPPDGERGPVWFYRSASGGQVLTDAYFTSLYNSGKGKTCDDTTETTNLVSCWEMDEDGGPYADSIGSNNLTAVNTPTQAAGLVERSDSGMSIKTVSGTSYTTDTLNWPASYTLSGWVFRSAAMYQGAVDTWVNETSYAIIDNCATLTLYIGDGSAAKSVAPARACDDTWTHLVVWYDASDKKARLNINGGADNTTAALAGTLYTTAVDFTLGRAAGSTTGGEFDMYALWSGIPGSTGVPTVAELYNAGAGEFYASAWFDMILNGPYFAMNKPIMLEPLRFPPPSNRFYVR